MPMYQQLSMMSSNRGLKFLLWRCFEMQQKHRTSKSLQFDEDIEIKFVNAIIEADSLVAKAGVVKEIYRRPDNLNCAI